MQNLNATFLICGCEQDFDRDALESTGNGIYTPTDPKLIPPLHLIYEKNPSDSGKARDSNLCVLKAIFLFSSLSPTDVFTCVALTTVYFER